MNWRRWVPTATGIATIFALGLSWGRFVLGPIPLDIKNLRWVWGDLSQVYVAWSQYGSDPHADWLSSNLLSYPLPMSIALFDPMPLFLVVAGPFGGLVPDGAQFFGYYFVACIALQGVFGYLAVLQLQRLTRIPLGPASHYLAVLGGLLIACIPYTFIRFQGHTALSSQWVLVLSIWVALASLAWQRTSWLIANCAVVLLATGVSPYLALMILVSNGFLTVLAWRRLRSAEVALRLGAMALVAGVGVWIFGFLGGGAGTRVDGYDVYSMNLLGPFDSNGVARLLPINVPDATGAQSFEGYVYLGAGVLVLLALTVLGAINHRLKSTDFPFIPALAIVLTCTLIAVTPAVTLATQSVQIPVPELVTAPLSFLHGTGRFFWMAGFWLILLCVATCILRFGIRWAAVVLTAVVVIQLVDISAIGMNTRAAFASMNAQRLRDVPAGDYSALLVYPAWQCDHGQTPGGIRNYEMTGYFATSHRIPTNSFYAARTPPGQSAYHCDYPKRLRSIDRRAVYLLSEPLFKEYGKRLNPSHRCVPMVGDEDALTCLPRLAR